MSLWFAFGCTAVFFETNCKMEKAKFEEIVQSHTSAEWLDIMAESDRRGIEWMQSGDDISRALALSIKQEQAAIYQAIKAKEAANIQTQPAWL